MRTKTKKVALFAKLVSLTVLVLVIQSLLYIPAAAAPTGQRLRALAGNFLVGYAAKDGFSSLPDAAQYLDAGKTEFNFVTPENSMKWDATEPSNNSFNFSGADAVVSFAQANNMKIHGHALVWHNQLPSWVSNGSWNSTTLTNAMYNHIDKVVNHWSDGTIYAWDVVNEAFNEDGSRRPSVFQNVIGDSFIELAFKRARAADSSAKLIYNDYNIETVNSKSTAMYNMVKDFKARGVPIDGVGLQMHLDGAIDYNSLAANMARFAALGVEIYITEMDVRYPAPISQVNLTAQATVYSEVLTRCRAQMMCKALQVWGITDKYSWVPSTFPGTGDALIFDRNYNAKPAYYALQTGLATTVGPTATKTVTQPALTTTPTRTNTPDVARDGWSTIQAESYTSFGPSGTSLQVCNGVLCYIASNAWAQYNNLDLHNGTNKIQISVANGGANSSIQVWVGGVNLGTLTVGSTGGWDSYQTKALMLTNVPNGVKDVKLVFVNGNLNVDWLIFSGAALPTNTFTKTATPAGTSTRTPTPVLPTNTNTPTKTNTSVVGRDGWNTIQAESYTSFGPSGTSLQVCNGVLCYITSNAWAQYNSINLHTGTNKIQISVANGGGNSNIQVWVGGVNVGTLTVGSTGGWNTYQTKSLTLSSAQSGVKDIKLVFVNGNLNVDWLVFSAAP